MGIKKTAYFNQPPFCRNIEAETMCSLLLLRQLLKIVEMKPVPSPAMRWDGCPLPESLKARRSLNQRGSLVEVKKSLEVGIFHDIFLKMLVHFSPCSTWSQTQTTRNSSKLPFCIAFFGGSNCCAMPAIRGAPPTIQERNSRFQGSPLRATCI